MLFRSLRLDGSQSASRSDTSRRNLERQQNRNHSRRHNSGAELFWYESRARHDGVPAARGKSRLYCRYRDAQSRPVCIVPDFNIKEWLRTLDEVAQLDFGQAVYSHSASGSPIGTKEDVTLTAAFITDMQAAIGAEFQKGTGFTDIPAARTLPIYDHLAGYDICLPPNSSRLLPHISLDPFPWRPH